LLVRDDVRARLLDALFGAEEEFDYSSVTEPVVPGGDPIGTAAAPDAAATAADEPGGDASDQATDGDPPEVARVVAPSPKAWKETAAEPPAQSGSVDAGEQASDTAPPAPPSDWWAPGESTAGPNDG
jgi:hypothetical protein